LVVNTWPSVSTPDHLAHYGQEIASQDLLHIAFALESDDILAKDRRRRKMIQTLSPSPFALKFERRHEGYRFYLATALSLIFTGRRSYFSKAER
jgi:hypothetical protein